MNTSSIKKGARLGYLLALSVGVFALGLFSSKSETSSPFSFQKIDTLLSISPANADVIAPPESSGCCEGSSTCS